MRLLTFIGLMFFNVVSFANAILCPPVDIIRLGSSKIDYAQPQTKKYYVAQSSLPIYRSENIDWFIATLAFNVKDEANAIRKAQLKVSRVTTSANTEAKHQDDYYECGYDNFSVIAWGKINEHTLVNPAQLNFNR